MNAKKYNYKVSFYRWVDLDVEETVAIDSKKIN